MFELAATLIPVVAAGKLSRSGTLMRVADRSDDLADGVRSLDHLADMSAVSRRAVLPDAADEAVDFARFGPCPIRLMPGCVAAGTLIATPDGGSKAIEDLRVGDRVASTNLNPTIPDGATTVDSVNWHFLQLNVESARPYDVYEIEALRPLDWILEHDAFAGRTICLDATESGGSGDGP